MKIGVVTLEMACAIPIHPRCTGPRRLGTSTPPSRKRPARVPSTIGAYSARATR